MTCEKVDVNAGYRACNEGKAIRNWYDRFGPDSGKTSIAPVTHLPAGKNDNIQSSAKACSPEPDNSWIARISPTIIPY